MTQPAREARLPRPRQSLAVVVREPKQERYGKVAVFRDPCGNLWDLLQPAAA